MIKERFLEAKITYVVTKSACEIAKSNVNNAERAFMERHGYSNKPIWAANVDEATFEKLCAEFETECANEINKLTKAEAALNEAEKLFAEIAISDVPLPAAKITAFKQKINTNAAIRSKVIDLAMKLDTRTMPA